MKFAKNMYDKIRSNPCVFYGFYMNEKKLAKKCK